jgi:hypothetical protein|tara:strand:+ start:309 stop:461 length:153 start_codon:yes stop_codon:yes gene_type:complete
MSESKKVLCTIPLEDYEWANRHDFSISKILVSAIKNHKESILKGTFGRDT